MSRCLGRCENWAGGRRSPMAGLGRQARWVRREDRRRPDGGTGAATASSSSGGHVGRGTGRRRTGWGKGWTQRGDRRRADGNAGVGAVSLRSIKGRADDGGRGCLHG